MKAISFLFCFVLVVFFVDQAKAYEATVKRIIDGDTIIVTRKDTGEEHKIRLYGIDAPEIGHAGKAKGQEHGESAKYFLQTILPIGYYCLVSIEGVDKYNRQIATIENYQGMLAHELMVLYGMAWVYDQYCHNCSALDSMEGHARADRRGIWATPSPMPPWVWRK